MSFFEKRRYIASVVRFSASMADSRRCSSRRSRGLIIILGSIKQPKGKKGDYKIEILAAKSVFFFLLFSHTRTWYINFFSFSAGSKKWADKAGKSKARKALGLFHNPKMKSEQLLLFFPQDQKLVSQISTDLGLGHIFCLMLSRVIRNYLEKKF